MNPDNDSFTSFRIVKNGIAQLIKESHADLKKLSGLTDDIKNVESDESEKIMKLLMDYHDNLSDENEIFKEFLVIFGKLLPIYETRMEIEKGIQEESDELFEQI